MNNSTFKIQHSKLIEVWTRDPFIILPKSSGDDNVKDIFAEKSRAAWNSQEAPEPRCDFAQGKISIQPHTGGFRSVTLWRRSVYGRTLSEIKEDPDMAGFFARQMAVLISSVIGSSLSPEQFIIVSPPKRRHPGKMNFASRMCASVAEILRIPYLDDFAVCRNRQRVNPDFSLGAPVPEQANLIVIDDIVTTGSTLIAMHSLIKSIGKNPIFFAAILNRR